MLSSTTVIDAGTGDGGVATDMEACEDRGLAFFYLANMFQTGGAPQPF